MSEQPTASDALALTPPEPVVQILPETAAARVRLDQNDVAAATARVAAFADDLGRLDVDDEEFRARIEAVDAIGRDELRDAGAASNRLLERPLRQLREGPVASNSTVGKSLVDLRNAVESLDPSKRGNLLEPRRLLGLIPFGNALRSYFEEYRSAQAHLGAIVDSLYRGRDELQRDNAAIEEQKSAMWEQMHKLQLAIFLCAQLDAALEERIARCETDDPARAKKLREDALFPLRQKRTDLLTQMAVNVQGYQALDLIKKNNLELIKGVDRATSTTLGALRTAVATAQALTNQKLVLGQIAALQSTTNAMIESTSKMLGEQGVAIYQQASAPSVDLGTLHRAFENVYAAMDALDAYKGKAAQSMAQTIDALTGEVDAARQHLS
ncbi:MAG: toxic anion resistance protein [Vulcanimicrobiaceae bacterium]